MATLGILCDEENFVMVYVAVHLGVKMADTLSFNAKVDMVDF